MVMLEALNWQGPPTTDTDGVAPLLLAGVTLNCEPYTAPAGPDKLTDGG